MENVSVNTNSATNELDEDTGSCVENSLRDWKIGVIITM